MALETRVTQVGIEAVSAAVPQPVRVTMVALEAVYLQPQPGRVTQVAAQAVFPLRPEAPRPLVPTYPIEEIWQWKTSIHKAYSGREQRMSLREEPYNIAKFNSPINSDEDYSAALYTVHRYQNEMLPWPMWQYATMLTAQTLAGATTLTFDFDATDVRPGELIAVMDSNMTFYETLEVATVSGTGCTVVTGPSQNLEAGYVVAPAPRCRSIDGTGVSMATIKGTVGISWQTAPGRALLRSGVTETVDTFDGVPVIEERPETNSAIPDSFNWERIVFDNMTNEPEYHDTWRAPQRATQRVYHLQDKTELDYWRQLFHNIRGARGAFLLPSFRHEMTLATTPALGATRLEINESRVAELMADKANQYLRIVTANGTIYRKVLEVRLNLDRTATVVLATALGGSAGDNTITEINIMTKYRLSGDQVSVLHYRSFMKLQITAMSVDE